MTLASPRVSNSKTTVLLFPRKVSSIAFAIGGLTSFVIFASLLLFTYPIGSSVTDYFYRTETTQNVQFHHSIHDPDRNPSPVSSSESPPVLTQDSDDKVLPKGSHDSNDVRLGEETNSGKSSNVSIDEEATQDHVETGTVK
ncbi:YLS7 [Arabidopsis thaliana]|jgi:hypothetical protein|uniref:YLS7 n=1 Tax=Arabidopsis thaliana TaxID=3702 RepID=A0A178UKD9_ARATH|nr:YLS7 [Arabidopsis thaliana]